MKKLFNVILTLTMMIPYQYVRAASSYDPTGDLMNAFGSKCNSHGALNAAADSDTSSLKSIIGTLKDDTTCHGIAGILDQISGLNIDQLQAGYQANRDQSLLATEINDLQSAIKAENAKANPDTALISAWELELDQANVNFIKAKGLSHELNLESRISTIKNFQMYATKLYGQLQNSECTSNPKHAGLKAEIGAQFLGLASTMAPGLIGSTMLGVGDILDNMFSFARENALADKIRDLTSSSLGQAAECAIDGVSASYCQARDSLNIIKTNAKIQEGQAEFSDPTYNGVNVVGKDMKTYIEFASRVKAGARADSGPRATEKGGATQTIANLEILQAGLDGAIGDGEKDLAEAPDPVGKLKQVIAGVANRMTGSAQPVSSITISGLTVDTPAGPLATFFVDDVSCGPLIYFYSIGRERSRRPPINALEPCQDYVTRVFTNPPTLDSVKINVNKAMAEAQTSIIARSSRIQEYDPELVFAEAYKENGNRIKPVEFLDNASAYLNVLLDEKDHGGIAATPRIESLIKKTIKQIQDTQDIIDHKYKPPPPVVKADAIKTPKTKSSTGPGTYGNGGSSIDIPPSPNPPPQKELTPAEELSYLQRIINPSGDVFNIPNELNQLVEQDIDHKIGQGKLDPALARNIELSVANSLGALIQQYIGLDSGKAQANNAKGSSKKTLAVVGDLFSKQLELRMQELMSSNDEPSQENLNLLCMRAALVPTGAMVGNSELKKFGKIDLDKYCKDRVYKSVYEKSGIVMEYNKIKSTKDFEERVCTVYDFFRKSYLYGLKIKHQNDRPRSTTQQAK